MTPAGVAVAYRAGRLTVAEPLYVLSPKHRRRLVAATVFDAWVDDLPVSYRCFTLSSLVASIHTAWRARDVGASKDQAQRAALTFLRAACAARRVVSLCRLRGETEWTFARPGAGASGEVLLAPDGTCGVWP